MVTVLFRVSVVLGLIGMGLGISMGIRQDFALVPAHAHLNLLGFVTLFLSALYYRTVPEAGASLVAKVQAATAIVGAIIFPIGIGCVVLGGRERFEPIVATGATIVFVGMALFAVIVFRTSNTTQPANPSARPQATRSSVERENHEQAII
jgi:hypothetical protein